MVINHNITAHNANRQLKFTGLEADKAVEKLASGKRINSAGDDASGLAVAEKMRSQVRGLQRATKNVEDGISFIQTTEGYLTEMNDITQRMRELSVQAANGIYTSDDRAQIQVEIDQLVEEVDRIAEQAQFNTMPMLKGGPAASGENKFQITFQVGANAQEQISVEVGSMKKENLFGDQVAAAAGAGATDPQAESGGTMLSVEDTAAATKSLGKIDLALNKITTQRAELGAFQNRMEHMVKGLSIASENMLASESRIRDTDMAQTMVEYTKNQILTQSGAAMLANANMKNQAVMRIIG